METFENSPLHHPNQCSCFHLVIFFIYFFLLGAGGACGLLLNGIFFWGGSCLGHSLAKAKTGNSFRGGVYSNLNVFGACLIHIS